MPTPLRELFDQLARGGVTDLLWSLGVVAAAIMVGRVLAYLANRLLARWARRTDSPLDDQIIARVYPPVRFLIPVLLLRAALPLSALPDRLLGPLNHICLITSIIGVGWLLARVVAVVEVAVNLRFDSRGADNLQARSVQTQMRGFRNIARFLVGLLSVAGVLMTFEGVRQLGVSLLASAGVAGIVIGFAAQRSIATIIAGIQIALTQPIRVDDVVIVEGEWGRIEEITLTYVVVRIWDLRRLIVPITYFIEKPFQNWTRVSADLLGTVFLYTDYTVSAESIRAELERLLNTTDLWDGKVCNLTVTSANDRTIELRALMSARESSALWDLRCLVREKLIEYLQREHPASLPVLRATLNRQDPG